jgi:dGTPase
MALHMDCSRLHPDPYLDDQTPLAIDRQRIIHAAAFRRLQYKTQVFVARHGDHFRSRLTHTLEVATLARRLAARLNLNADLAEAVALAHDLGHPPFGHAGERALDECMRGHGLRFEHNEHTLRVVTELEHPYPDFHGLNLTAAVRACLHAHHTEYDRPAGAACAEDAPAEGRVADLADEFAYVTHDLQDGLHAGLLEAGELQALELWRECAPAVDAPGRGELLRHLRPTIERIQTRLIADAAASSAPGRPEISAAARRQLQELNALLRERVYKHHHVVRMDEKARRIVRAVFAAYVENPALMPQRYARRVERDGAPRVAADYAAGMTDRFCQDEHARLFDARMDV